MLRGNWTWTVEKETPLGVRKSENKVVVKGPQDERKSGQASRLLGLNLAMTAQVRHG